MLVSTGSVARECRRATSVDRSAVRLRSGSQQRFTSRCLHGEFDAMNALIGRGARIDLPVAAALGRIEDARRLLPGADTEDRHLALALASQFGHVEIVRLLLDAGEDPNRYNPVGGHSHSTPLHQAAGSGHDEVVRLLVERGARLDLKDILWRAHPPIGRDTQAGQKSRHIFVARLGAIKGPLWMNNGQPFPNLTTKGLPVIGCSALRICLFRAWFATGPIEIDCRNC